MLVSRERSGGRGVRSGQTRHRPEHGGASRSQGSDTRQICLALDPALSRRMPCVGAETTAP